MTVESKGLHATKLSWEIETFPIRGHFTISRGSISKVRVVTVTLTSDRAQGQGECVPHDRYGEDAESVTEAISKVAPLIESRPDRAFLQTQLPAGAARNAIDAALWDLEAKYTGVRVLERLNILAPSPVVTAFTISLDKPATMAAVAAREATRPLLKLKLGGEGDEERLRAVRAAVPNATLIVDANESWAVEDFPYLMAACVETNVKLIEQPLPAQSDAALRNIVHPIPICADESIRDQHHLEELRDRYDAVNVKLDKTGGLTEALETVARAKALGYKIMVGSKVGSSLAMAPALMLAHEAQWVDLDGPLLLESDRVPGLKYEGSEVKPSEPSLWG